MTITKPNTGNKIVVQSGSSRVIRGTLSPLDEEIVQCDKIRAVASYEERIDLNLAEVRAHCVAQ